MLTKAEIDEFNAKRAKDVEAVAKADLKPGTEIVLYTLRMLAWAGGFSLLIWGISFIFR